MFDTDRDAVDAIQRIEIRWKDLSRYLEAAGAPARVLASIAELLDEVRPLGASVVIVACDDEVLLLEGADERLGQSVARVGPVPSLGAVLGWRQHALPYIVVACDRAGADLAVSAPGTEVAFEAGDPDVHDPLLHKRRGGGWSNLRFQRRVENAWEQHAREVLSRLDDLVNEMHPRVVVYGGDVRACALLEEHATAPIRSLLVRADISRAVDGSEQKERDELRRVLETVVATDTAVLLGRFRELESKSLAVHGAPAVFDALNASQVDTLLIHDDPTDERRAFISREPFAVSTDRAAVSDLAVPQQARLVDAAIAAAFLSGASVRMVPRSPLDAGIGALLRFAQ